MKINGRLRAQVRGLVKGYDYIQMGTDPEFFLRDKDQKLIPAFKVLPEGGKGNEVFADGFQAEINPQPGGCLSGLRYEVKRLLHKAAAKGTICFDNMVELGPEDLEGAGKWAQLGCQPSINLYGNYPNIPLDGVGLMYRFAGGHIHFGQLCNKAQTTRVVQALDSVLATWLTGVGAGIESPIRRQYYGCAGEFREQKWGPEYRTPGNIYLRHPSLWAFTMDLARKIFNLARKDQFDVWHGKLDYALRAVNLTEPETARAIIHRNKKVFLQLAKSANNTYRYSHNPGISDGSLAYDLCMNGYDKYFSQDVFANWRLNDKVATLSGWSNPELKQGAYAR